MGSSTTPQDPEGSSYIASLPWCTDLNYFRGITIIVLVSCPRSVSDGIGRHTEVQVLMKKQEKTKNPYDKEKSNNKAVIKAENGM